MPSSVPRSPGRPCCWPSPAARTRSPPGWPCATPGRRAIPYHLYLVPGLAFVGESLDYYARWFGTPILNLPHPSLYRWLAHLVYQPPERCRVIEAAQITVPTYATLNTMLRERLGLPGDTWVCDGVRAADSPARRAAVVRHGPVSDRRRTQKVVWGLAQAARHGRDPRCRDRAATGVRLVRT